MKSLNDYTEKEIKRFAEMQNVLTEYNEQVQSGMADVKEKPPFTDQEMFELSRYQQLVLSAKAKALYS